MSVVPVSKKADLGSLSPTTNLTPALKGDGALGEYIVCRPNNNGEHLVLDACGGAAVACFGNGGAQLEQEADFQELFGIVRKMYEEREKYKDNPYGRVMLATFNQIIDIPYSMHYAYTTLQHSLLTERLRDNSNNAGTVWENEEEKMHSVMILNSGKSTHCSSGSEVCDAMTKLVYQYWNGKVKSGGSGSEDPKKEIIITRNTSYHGNTVQALSLSEFPVRQANFDGLLPKNNLRKTQRYYSYRDKREDQSQDDYDDWLIKELVDTIEMFQYDLDVPEKNTVAAFVIETVSGAALGCQMPSVRYLRKVKKVCRDKNILLVYDEIMCGSGRLGYANAWQYFDEKFRDDYVMAGRKNELPLPGIKNLAPDIMLIGKTLGAGIMPAAGVMCNKKIVDKLQEENRVLKEFSHGHTYQAHGAVCAAALEAQTILPDLLPNIRRRGEQLGQGLRELASRHAHIGDVRGHGLFWGVEFVRDKKTKQPFHPDDDVSSNFVRQARFPDLNRPEREGLDVYAGQWTGPVDAKGYRQGDHVIIAPAYHSSENLIKRILESFDGAVTDYFTGREFSEPAN